MLQSGYAADFILALTVEELLREIQAAGAMGMRVEEDKAKGTIAVLFMRRDDVAPDIQEKQKEVRRLLRLSEERQKFVLKYSPARGEEDELAVNSRSMLQIYRPHRSPRTSRSPEFIFAAARKSLSMRTRPCIIAITGSGSTTATGRRSVRWWR